MSRDFTPKRYTVVLGQWFSKGIQILPPQNQTDEHTYVF